VSRIADAHQAGAMPLPQAIHSHGQQSQVVPIAEFPDSVLEEGRPGVLFEIIPDISAGWLSLKMVCPSLFRDQLVQRRVIPQNLRIRKSKCCHSILPQKPRTARLRFSSDRHAPLRKRRLARPEGSAHSMLRLLEQFWIM
jgi:hypothetical protein